VATCLKENHHLPEIPSASEVEDKGVSLGEMQSKLVAKIEELTLHMIHADEKIRALDRRNDRLELANREMRTKLRRIEERNER
jgi:hypothetical protein